MVKRELKTNNKKNKKKRTPVQLAKDKLREKLTAHFKRTLKEKLAACDTKWRKRLEHVKLDARKKREAAAERRLDTKERKRKRFWNRKARNAGIHGHNGTPIW